MFQMKNKALTKEVVLSIEEKDVDRLLNLLNEFKETGKREETFDDEVGNRLKFVILPQ